MKLGALAEQYGLGLQGDPELELRRVCTLADGAADGLAFLANPKYRGQLATTSAGAVLLTEPDADGFGGNALLAKDPYLAFARIAVQFDPYAEFQPGVHPQASVDPGASVPASCAVGAGAVIEADVVLGEGVYVGAGSVLRAGSRVGEASRIEGRVFIGAGVRIGRRASLQPGASIGGRGFGLAQGPDGWEPVPQVGGVVLGDDVEVGANTTIDRGAIGDTVLEDGVKLDNLIQVAHNVHIGAHTAMASMSGIAGSTRVGARCMIGGCTCINGHIEIAENVSILGYSMVTKSVTEPGASIAGIPAVPVAQWRREIGQKRRLGRMEERIKALEAALAARGARGDA